MEKVDVLIVGGGIAGASLGARLAGDAKAAYVEDLEGDVQALHARHLELWNSLDADVREALASRFHDRMEGHGEGPFKAFHERLRRMHGGGH